MNAQLKSLCFAVSVGDCIDATLVSALDGGLQIEGRINGRRAFLDRRSGPARPGDRFELKVTGVNPKRTVYFVKPVRLIELGDGKSSSLQAVRQAIFAAGNGDVLRGLLLVQARLGNNHRARLQFLFNLVETFELEEIPYGSDLNLRPLVDYIIETLIAAYPDGGASRTDAARLFAGVLELRFTTDRYDGRGSILHLLNWALEQATIAAPDRQQDLLTWILNYRSSLSRERHISLLERLIEINEREDGTLDIVHRTNLALELEASLDFDGVLFWLQPVMARRDAETAPVIRGELARLLASACAQKGDIEAAKSWLAQAESLLDSFASRDALAALYFDLGEFKKAAALYRELYEEFRDSKDGYQD